MSWGCLAHRFGTIKRILREGGEGGDGFPCTVFVFIFIFLVFISSTFYDTFVHDFIAGRRKMLLLSLSACYLVGNLHVSD